MFSDHILCCGNVHTLGVFLLYILVLYHLRNSFVLLKLILLHKMTGIEPVKIEWLIKKQCQVGI